MARTLDDTAEHLIRILRFGGQTAELVTQTIFDGRDDIIQKILRSNQSPTAVQGMITREITQLGRDVNGILVDQGEIAADFQARSSAGYLTVLGVANPAIFNPSQTFVRRSFRIPMDAQNITVNDMLTGQMAGMRKDMVNVTRTAVIEGQTIRSTSRFIEESLGGLSDASLRRKSEALARTAISQVANLTRFESFQAEEEVRGVLYVATLDGRTSDVCKVLDGTFYSSRARARVPPVHVNCRSTLVPVLKGESLDEVKDQLRRPSVEPKSVAQLNRQGLRTRTGRIRRPSRRDTSPLRGVQTRQYRTYQEWLQTQPAAYQQAILGPKAFNKFKETGNLQTALGVAV